MDTILIRVVDGHFSIVRLDPSQGVPEWATEGQGLWSVTHRRDEISIVVESQQIPDEIPREGDYTCLALVGPLAFEAIGILAHVSSVLARAEIPLLAISTYDTDLILVREDRLAKALSALADADVVLETEDAG